MGETEKGMQAPYPPQRTYVIRSGRMTDAQKRAIERDGDDFIIPFTGKLLDMEGIFPDAKPIIMEIGFGMGQASWKIAMARPQYNYLGVEVHAPGVGKLILDLKSNSISNFRIFQHDAIEILQTMIPERSLAGFHIFYPDPWPKKRHHKRRLMQECHIALMLSRLAPGGYLYFVTDIEEYARSTLSLLSRTEGLDNAYDGYAEGIGWRPETKFERRAKELADGGSPTAMSAYELYFVKR
ncbi:MAG: tRNA (guanosine(46)-N7)-methyltransferase TrmB [Spirochaetaceae bacterium]|nr:tRNA (guanosine(46)-N7)-methyltransferase TrmB [Spirochaetaceae bacterium]